VRARPAGCPDEQVPAAEALDQRQADAARLEPNESDAWDGARRGEAADVHHQLQTLLAAEDAGKSADPERVARAPGASFPPQLPLAVLVLVEQDAVAELYTPDEARSAEQSCAAQVAAARQQPAARTDAVHSGLRERQAARKRSSMAPWAQAE
jgi:hypothetical protein